MKTLREVQKMLCVAGLTVLVLNTPPTGGGFIQFIVGVFLGTLALTLGVMIHKHIDGGKS